MGGCAPVNDPVPPHDNAADEGLFSAPITLCDSQDTNTFLLEVQHGFLFWFLVFCFGFGFLFWFWFFVLVLVLALVFVFAFLFFSLLFSSFSFICSSTFPFLV
jgi:hypothetical protein